MNSILDTLLTTSNLQFAKNVIANMKDSLTMPIRALKLLDKERKAIYYKCYNKWIDCPNWYENDSDNMFYLKEFIKYLPYQMAEDYIGFTECWEEDPSTEGRPYKIDCPKIKRQYRKIVPIIEKIQKVRKEMNVSLEESTKMVEFVDWLTLHNEKIKQLHTSYKQDTGENCEFMYFADYLYKNDKTIVNWHKEAA